MSKPNPQTYWAQRCVDSQHTMAMLPVELNEVANEIIEQGEKLQIESVLFEAKAAEFWSKARVALYKKGYRAALSNGLGWNEDAMNDGIKVVNIVKKQG